ncbi:hypothetical protein [Enterovirga sp.]|jgi:hypothetical protein|uniref:hypothetical protein n=1 Tax=Enterovirga sp. TaxID=2026350 RepID=UPI00262F995E|nr:hypothetical protein [Enterovirga sp.]MDB5590824.1 hypothetical protein [Enterovirga sp.]
MFTVKSHGPIGATTASVKTVPDVDLYVAQLAAKGHRVIMVAAGVAPPEPYESWRTSQLGPRARGLI